MNGQGQRETRAESTISKSLEPISAAERTGGLPWMDLCRIGSQNNPDITIHSDRVSFGMSADHALRVWDGSGVFQGGIREAWNQFRPLSGQMASRGWI